MLTFKLIEKSDWVAFPLVVLLVSLTVTASTAQNASEPLSVRPGDTFAVSRPVDSTFHVWKLESYDVRKLSLKLKQPPDTIGNYRYVFEALGKGQVTLVFTKYLNTALRREKLDTQALSVTIEDRPPQPEPDEEPEPSPSRQPEEAPEPEPSQPTVPHETEQESPNPVGVDEAPWDRANELIETEQFDQARELIDEQIQSAAGAARQQWMELKAKSFMKQNNYTGAIDVWKSMLDEFPNGPKARWLSRIANAHQENGQPEQAQLSYLEIRHRFPDSSQWVDAMRKLAELALGNNNIDRARRLLERARSRVNPSDHPQLLMELGKIYDRYPSTRDYPKAVRFYENAAKAFDPSDTRAKAARDRADYLNQNFLQFGTE